MKMAHDIARCSTVRRERDLRLLTVRSAGIVVVAVGVPDPVAYGEAVVVVVGREEGIVLVVLVAEEGIDLAVLVVDDLVVEEDLRGDLQGNLLGVHRSVGIHEGILVVVVVVDLEASVAVVEAFRWAVHRGLAEVDLHGLAGGHHVLVGDHHVLAEADHRDLVVGHHVVTAGLDLAGSLVRAHHHLVSSDHRLLA